MANRYSITPPDITQGVQGLVGSIKSSRAESKMEKLREKAATIYDRGDPDEISRFMISNPEFQQVFQGQMDMKQQQRTQMFTETAKNVLAGGQPNFESLVDTAEQMIDAGEDASDVLDLIDKYSQSPEVATKTAENVMALYDPQGFQSYKGAQGGGKSTPATDSDDFVADSIIVYKDKNPDATKAELAAERKRSRLEHKRIQATEAADIKTATSKAAADVATEVVEEKTRKANAQTFAVYQEAAAGLTEALSGTTTGPGMGYLPTVTTSSQIAKGAKAVFAPVLKQIFRASGEGTFTKDDQEILMAMLPDENDTEEAAVTKMKMVDSVVRRKLGQPPADQAPSPQSTQTPTVTTQIEFDNLPSGSIYLEDGKQYRKP